MNCDSARTIHTVGHSTRTIETFLALLEAHEIELIVDVRRWPASRRHPQFHREALSNSLEQAGVDYLLWFVEEVERLAGVKRTAFMCAEAVPWRCHRQLLADAFLVRGWSVGHIMDNGCHAHSLPPFAHPEGAKIYYRGLL